MEHELNKFEELAIPLPNGGSLCCGPGNEHEFGRSVVIRDKDGNEVVMWDADEWTFEPEEVMGAIFGASLTPMDQLLTSLKRTKVVDGCWQ